FENLLLYDFIQYHHTAGVTAAIMSTYKYFLKARHKGGRLCLLTVVDIVTVINFFFDLFFFGYPLAIVLSLQELN
ncbi:MAG: hypothetical protein O7D30_01030, partial [Rickettsia endosymbiont of Ixodes persulcatus]|nr:hypothetical protein [Rickettsia endosymbiont of Ixodes persulcatus]